MEVDSLKEKLVENLQPVPPVGVWVQTSALKPTPGMMVVRYYPESAVYGPCKGYWAGEHSEKASLNFSRWMRLE